MSTLHVLGNILDGRWVHLQERERFVFKFDGRLGAESEVEEYWLHGSKMSLMFFLCVPAFFRSGWVWRRGGNKEKVRWKSILLEFMCEKRGHVSVLLCSIRSSCRRRAFFFKTSEKSSGKERKTLGQFLVENKTDSIRTGFFGWETFSYKRKSLSVMMVASRTHDLIIGETAVN